MVFLNSHMFTLLFMLGGGMGNDFSSESVHSAISTMLLQCYY